MSGIRSSWIFLKGRISSFYQNLPLFKKFCLGIQQGIIQIEQGGEIKAIGEGTATVVVCANDEIYKQCDFTVTSVSVEVTKQKTANDYVEEITKAPVNTEKTKEQRLYEIGININKLKNNDEYYLVPVIIAGATVIIGLSAFGIRKAVERKKRNKNESDD